MYLGTRTGVRSRVTRTQARRKTGWTVNARPKKKLSDIDWSRTKVRDGGSPTATPLPSAASQGSEGQSLHRTPDVEVRKLQILSRTQLTRRVLRSRCSSASRAAWSPRPATRAVAGCDPAQAGMRPE